MYGLKADNRITKNINMARRVDTASKLSYIIKDITGSISEILEWIDSVPGDEEKRYTDLIVDMADELLKGGFKQPPYILKWKKDYSLTEILCKRKYHIYKLLRGERGYKMKQAKRFDKRDTMMRFISIHTAY